MKPNIVNPFYLLLFFLLFPGALYAQSLQFGRIPKDAIKLSVSSLLTSEAKIQFERRLKKKISFTVDAGYGSNIRNLLQNKNSSTYYYTNKSGYECGVALRMYLNRDAVALKGVYLGSFYTYSNMLTVQKGHAMGGSANFTTSTRDAMNELGIMTGRQWVFRQRIAIDFNAGIGVGNLYSRKSETGSEYNNFYDRSSSSNRVASTVSGNLNVGYLF